MTAPDRNGHRLRRVYQVLSVLVCGTLIAVLLLTVSWLPRFGSADNPAENEVYLRYTEDELAEAGAVNTVAGMILDYRAFDTLGESNVLFTAVCSVLILLRADRNRKGALNIPALEAGRPLAPDDGILRRAAGVLVPIGLLFGIYVIANGHLSAGGGFSGGAVIGACLMLFSAACGPERLEHYFTMRACEWITFASLMTYTLLKAWSFYAGANGLDSHISAGIPGTFRSGGMILPLNICVGLVVACTMYAFYALFTKGGFGHGR